MANIYKSSASGPAPPGTVLFLKPDVGADVPPNGSGEIAVSGTPTGAGSSVLENNFETFNAGTNVLQVAHRYQGAATTTDGVTAVTILTIPINTFQAMNISAQFAGIALVAGNPKGVGGEIRGTVFKAGLGSGVVLGVPDKAIRASVELSAATANVAVDGGGNNLILTVTGEAGQTIEWYVIAEIVFKTSI